MKPFRFALFTIALIPLLLSSACISNSGTGLTLSSPNFSDGGSLPVEFTCNGEDISPELEWSGAPTNSKSFALIMQDPDAPGGVFTHWMIYDMAISMIYLPKRMSPMAKVMGGSMQGTNDFGDVGYGGPCPPPGETHHYVFTLYALDVAKCGVSGTFKGPDVLAAIRGHVLGQAALTGVYSLNPSVKV